MRNSNDAIRRPTSYYDSYKSNKIMIEEKKMSGAALRWKQMKTLWFKGFYLALRGYLFTIARLFVAALLVGYFCLIVVIGGNGGVRNPPIGDAIGGIPKCRDAEGDITGDKGNCITLYYSPVVQETTDIMTILAENNKPKLTIGNEGDNNYYDIVGTSMNETALFAHVLKHPNTTQSAIYFKMDGENLRYPNIKYKIYYNNTYENALFSFSPAEPELNYQFETQLGIDRAIMQYYGKTNGFDSVNFWEQIQLKFQNFPTTENPMVVAVIVAFITAVVFFAMTLPFLFDVLKISTERIDGHRGYMKLVGLKDTSWWVATIVEHSLFYIVSMVLMLIVGYIIGIPFFRACNPLVHIILYLDYGFVMLGMALLVCTLINDKKFVMVAAFIILIVGFSFAFMVVFSDDTFYFLWAPSFVDSKGPWGAILSLFPPFDFCMALLAIKLKTQGYIWTYQRNELITEGGFSLADMYKVPEDLIAQDIGFAPTFNYFLLYMFVSGVIYFALALYLDQVLPDKYRVAQHPLFFLKPSWWKCTKSVKTKNEVLVDNNGDNGDDDEAQFLLDSERNEDEDVRYEKTVNEAYRDNYLSDTENDASHALAICNLIKTFASRSIPFCGKKKVVQAVRGLNLGANNGELLCLLGHNGAGKTTTINILTGVLKPTSGDAFLHGMNVLNEMELIREVSGVCPQFDVLWEELTPRQHVLIMSSLKPYGSALSSTEIEDVLHAVRLDKVIDQQVKTFSGGMKRRLSVALSTLNNPKIIFMDEPTTGMDVGNRRHIWELILKLRKDRLIILTTHSMEEAEVLGEKIAVMAHGKLSCVGNSLHLKSKYGCGYRLKVLTNEEHVDTIINVINNKLPSASLKTSNSGSLIFGLSSNAIKNAGDLFHYFNTEQYIDNTTGLHRLIVNDWGISHTTLEDVFIKTTKDAHHQHHNEQQDLLFNNTTTTNSNIDD